jgi:hypothetical protein
MRRLILLTALLAAPPAAADDTTLPFCPRHGDHPDSDGDFRCDACGFDDSMDALEESGVEAAPSRESSGGGMSKGQSFAIAFLIAIAITVVVVVAVVFAL